MRSLQEESASRAWISDSDGSCGEQSAGVMLPGADTQLGGLGLESLLWAQLVSVADLWVVSMLFIGDVLHRRRHGQISGLMLKPSMESRHRGGRLLIAC